MTRASARNPSRAKSIVAIAEPIKQEHQRIGEKGGELPELEHERASMRSERDAEPLLFGEHAEIAHRHAGGDARQHARGAEMFGDQERAESGDHGQRRLDQMVLGGSHDHDGDQPDAESGGEAAAGDDRQMW